MPLKLTDTIVAPSRGAVDEAMAYAKRQGAKRQEFLSEYFAELWRLCKVNGFDFSVLVSQSANETDSWRSPIWQQYGNPAGLAVTNSENKSLIYDSGIEAARAHVVHMWAYRYGRVPKGSEIEKYIPLDGHYAEVFTTNDTRGNPLAGSVRTVGDFNVNGRWALLDRQNTPRGPLDDYGNRIAQNGRTVWPNLPNQVTTPATDPEPIPGEGDSDMAVSTKKFSKQLVGFQANVPNQKLNVGPGQLEEIVHNTDNPGVGANAQMHRDYVANGGGPGRVSYHSTCDSTQIIQILKLDQVAWHAGDGCNDRDGDEGCFWGISTECCVNADGNLDITFENCAYWMAMVEFGDPRIDYGTMPKAYFEGFIDRTLGHQQVSDDGKYCPRAFLDKWGSAWLPKLKARAHFYLNEMRGTASPPSTTYADAHPVDKGSQIINEHVFLAPGGKTFQMQTTPREYGDPGAKATGPDIAKGTKITQDQISHYVVGTGDVPNIWLVLTGVENVKDGSRVPADAVIAA